MFTGLVEELGEVKGIEHGKNSVRITISGQKVLMDVQLGDSIAVNGTCLTVVEYTSSWFVADVMPETVRCTVLADLRIGNKVNLERTLRLGDRLGGHLVSGHVDGVGIITRKTRNDNAIIVQIEAEASVMKYVIPKGSIAIDGISLTVVEASSDCFSVSLIPHTAHLTTLGLKKTGERVNLESDMIGKYVEKLLRLSREENKKSNLTLGILQQNGFV